jgi:hypothetical protein
MHTAHSGSQLSMKGHTSQLVMPDEAKCETNACVDDSHAARKAALRPPLIVYANTPQGISSDAALMFMPVLCSVVCSE